MNESGAPVQPIHLWGPLFVTLSSIRERTIGAQKGNPQVNRLATVRSSCQFIVRTIANWLLLAMYSESAGVSLKEGIPELTAFCSMRNAVT